MNLEHATAFIGGIICVLTYCSSREAYGELPDPCSFLTQAEVASALGVQVGEGRLVARTLCEWAVQGPPSLDAKKVTVTLVDANGFGNAKMPAGHGISKVLASGIGDEAIFGTTPHTAITLAVKKGDVYFIVHVWGFPMDRDRDVERVKAMEKTLALEIVAKL